MAGRDRLAALTARAELRGRWLGGMGIGIAVSCGLLLVATGGSFALALHDRSWLSEPLFGVVSQTLWVTAPLAALIGGGIATAAGLTGYVGCRQAGTWSWPSLAAAALGIVDLGIGTALVLGLGVVVSM